MASSSIPSSSTSRALSSDRFYSRSDKGFVYSISKSTFNELRASSYNRQPIAMSYTIESLSAEPLSSFESETLEHAEALFLLLKNGYISSAETLLKRLQNTTCSLSAKTALKALHILTPHVNHEHLNIIKKFLTIVKRLLVFTPQAPSDSNEDNLDLPVMQDILSAMEAKDHGRLTQFLTKLKEHPHAGPLVIKALEKALDQGDLPKIRLILPILSRTHLYLRIPHPVQPGIFQPLDPLTSAQRTQQFLQALRCAPSSVENSQAAQNNLDLHHEESSIAAITTRNTISSASNSANTMRPPVVKRERNTDALDAPPSKKMKIKAELGASSSVSSNGVDPKEAELYCSKRQKSWINAVKIDAIDDLEELCEKDLNAPCKLSASTRLEALKLAAERKSFNIAQLLLEHESKLRSRSYPPEKFYRKEASIDSNSLIHLLITLAKNEEDSEILNLFLNSPRTLSPTIQLRAALALFKEPQREAVLRILEQGALVGNADNCDLYEYQDILNQFLTSLISAKEEAMLEILIEKSYIKVKFIVDNYQQLNQTLITKFLSSHTFIDTEDKKQLNKLFTLAAENQDLETIKILIANHDQCLTRTTLSCTLTHILKTTDLNRKHSLLEAVLQTNWSLTPKSISTLSSLINNDSKSRELFNNYLKRTVGVVTYLNELDF